MGDLYITGLFSKYVQDQVFTEIYFTNTDLLGSLPKITFTTFLRIENRYDRGYKIVFSEPNVTILIYYYKETLMFGDKSGVVTPSLEVIRIVRNGIDYNVNTITLKVGTYDYQFIITTTTFDFRSAIELNASVKIPKRENINLAVINIPKTNMLQFSKISVPIIKIVGQTLIDGSDVGNIIFTIEDEFQYYNNNIPPEFNICKNYEVNLSQLKITQFTKHCPKIVSVVIGEDNTWYDKTVKIFRTLGEQKIGSNFDGFRSRMIFYAMLKFILSRILYGKFNINFLLGKYNETFLNDLGNSRFCKALKLFLDRESIIFGYDKYFKLK